METPTLFDPLTAWDALSPEQQRRIGAAAIALGTAQVVGSAIRDAAWSWEAAHFAAGTLINAAVDAVALPGDVPDLNSLGVRMCRGCGCTDLVGCAGGCSWASQTRCTSCRRKRVAV